MDFTSAPSRSKPLTQAGCDFDGKTLRVEECVDLISFEKFEGVLGSPGPWIAGIDFPFGQPCELIADLGWQKSCEEYVGKVAEMWKTKFEQILQDYRDNCPAGVKELRRQIDKELNDRSPTKLYRPPVGKMFYQGAPCLLGFALPPSHG